MQYGQKTGFNKKALEFGFDQTLAPLIMAIYLVQELVLATR